MPVLSAGILAFRFLNNELQVFLVHPGGPLWAKKDAGAWSIPKGEYDKNEDGLSAAKREFTEETGQPIDGNFIKLKSQKLKSGKIIHAFAVKADVDETSIKSNFFPLEWPLKSGKTIQVPEVDKGGWFNIQTAKEKINAGQIKFIDELAAMINDEIMIDE